MAEPYRMPQLVARRLASLSVAEKARPLLTGFQEPSMIYEIGRPVAVMHGSRLAPRI